MDQLVEQSKLLKFRPDTLEAVRRELNTDKQQINDSIDLLEDWLKKQNHFIKRIYSRDYLERTLGTCKASVERTKMRIDKLCTFRTLIPEFFSFHDAKKELAMIKEFMSAADIPKLTSDQIRVFFVKIHKDTFKSADMFNVYKYFTLICEYMNRFEYCSGFRVILDCRYINILTVATKINPMDLKKMMTVLIEGYCMRVKGIHIITDSILVDSFVSLIKQVVSPKIAGRVYVHQTSEEIQEFVPKDLLPEDYGGDEKSLKLLFEDWYDEITSDEHLEYVQEMCTATTDESCRLHNTFNEHYLGMPGSFRAMRID